MDENIGNRVLELIKYLGTTKAGFSSSIGLKNNSTITRIVSGKSSPGYEILYKIVATYPEVNCRWLLTGEGKMLIKELNVAQIGDKDEVFRLDYNRQKELNEEKDKRIEVLELLLKEKDECIKLMKWGTTLFDAK